LPTAGGPDVGLDEIPTSRPKSRPRFTRDPDSVFIGYIKDFVHKIHIEHCRHARFVAEERGDILRFDGDDAPVRVMFEQEANALQGAAAANAGNKASDVAVHLEPKLGRCLLVVDARVAVRPWRRSVLCGAGSAGCGR